jgi:hypothetical protein
MTTRNHKNIDPMREGHPEPFSEPRTIPTGWDVTGWINPEDDTSAQVNGTAFNQTNPTFSKPYDKTENPV